MKKSEFFPQTTDFVLQTIDWYRQNARDLPWRNTKNAYFIWLSEVILQQTRVQQGYDYYQKFVGHFPAVENLAAASEEEVLKLWQGLGYYSRARNLRITAMEVVARFGGKFPVSYVDLLSLKGIGPYTAAAIASFAYDLPYAVVDGNVYRVLSRYFGIDTPIDTTAGKKEFEELAQALIPVNQPAVYNQAMMEFGALYCTPVNPNCELCVLQTSCASGMNEKWRNRPVKSKKTGVRNRYFHYLHLVSDDGIALNKRSEKDIWQGLYEFPLIETNSTELTEVDLKEFGITLSQLNEKYRSKHILSHQHIHAVFYQVEESKALESFTLVSMEELHLLPVHRLMHKYMERFL